MKSSSEIEKIRRSGKILTEIFETLSHKIVPGISTKYIDRIVYGIITARGAQPSFLNYGNPPFPASICASVNEEVVHGIPSNQRILEEGDIISIDVGACLDGFHADAARTYPVGKISEEAANLIKVTKECFFKGYKEFKPNNRIRDISRSVQNHAEANGYGVVRALTGHGIGRNLHEDPNVPNYVTDVRGIKISTGLVIALEPMINAGTWDVYMKSDNWTIVTADGKLSAHYENTIAMTENGPVMLTGDEQEE